MRPKAFVAALLLGLLACSALAGPGPRVDQPKEGDVLGPDYVISGSTGQKALVVILTDVVLTDTGRVQGTVPGIRHYTKDDGSFQFRCASPRVPMGSRQADVIYRIRCFVMGPGGKAGPETVVTCKAGTRSFRDSAEWSNIAVGEWNLKLLNEKRPVEGSRITATFTDGRISGTGGINRYFGNYKISGSELSFSDMGATKMAGDPAQMMQEQEYFNALQAATGHQVRGSELVIYDASGKIIIAFGRNAPGTTPN